VSSHISASFSSWLYSKLCESEGYIEGPPVPAAARAPRRKARSRVLAISSHALPDSYEMAAVPKSGVASWACVFCLLAASTAASEEAGATEVGIHVIGTGGGGPNGSAFLVTRDDRRVFKTLNSTATDAGGHGPPVSSNQEGYPIFTVQSPTPGSLALDVASISDAELR
jgi:hypothetical protein